MRRARAQQALGTYSFVFFWGRLSVLDFLSLARKLPLPDACPKTVYQTYATFLFRSTLETLQWDGTKLPHFLFPSSKGHGQTLALRSHDQPPTESCDRRVGKIASPKKRGTELSPVTLSNSAKQSQKVL